jgi:hypothetical protein
LFLISGAPNSFRLSTGFKVDLSGLVNVRSFEVMHDMQGICNALGSIAPAARPETIAVSVSRGCADNEEIPFCEQWIDVLCRVLEKEHFSHVKRFSILLPKILGNAGLQRVGDKLFRVLKPGALFLRFNHGEQWQEAENWPSYCEKQGLLPVPKPVEHCLGCAAMQTYRS